LHDLPGYDGYAGPETPPYGTPLKRKNIFPFYVYFDNPEGIRGLFPGGGQVGHQRMFAGTGDPATQLDTGLFWLYPR